MHHESISDGKLIGFNRVCELLIDYHAVAYLPLASICVEGSVDVSHVGVANIVPASQPASQKDKPGCLGNSVGRHHTLEAKSCEGRSTFESLSHDIYSTNR